MDTAQIIHRDPKTLRAHPINKPLPKLQPGMPEWSTLVDDIAAVGVRDPIWITDAGQVVDGETRRQAAIAAGLTSVPCRVVAPGDVMVTIREKLVLQKHLTKGQRAYVVYPFLKGIVDELRASGGKSNLRIGVGLPGAASGGAGKLTIEELAGAWGFAKDTLDRAADLHGIWEGDRAVLRRRNLDHLSAEDLSELRSIWEPRILDLSSPKPVGLGAALAGIAGSDATAGIERTVNQHTQLELFTDGLDSLTKSLDARRWRKTATEARSAILANWRKRVSEWDNEARRELAAALMEGLE